MSEYVKVFIPEDISKETGLVLVDFWAAWCGPCRMLAPTVEQIAEELKDSLVVGKINIDEHTDYAVGLGIMSIPTLILFKDGKEVERTIGVQSKNDLLEMIRRAQ